MQLSFVYIVLGYIYFMACMSSYDLWRLVICIFFLLAWNLRLSYDYGYLYLPYMVYQSYGWRLWLCMMMNYDYLFIFIYAIVYLLQCDYLSMKCLIYAIIFTCLWLTFSMVNFGNKKTKITPNTYIKYFINK